MDWIEAIKPFVSLNSDENDVEKIIKCLVENAQEITKSQGQLVDGFIAIASVEIFKHCLNVSIKELKDATTASEVILNYILQNLDQLSMSVKVEILRYLTDGENYADLLSSPPVTYFIHYDPKKHKEASTTSNTKDEKKLERNQVNLSILDHLTTPILHRRSEKVDATNSQKLLIKSNINYLKKHKAGEILLDRFMMYFINIEKYFDFFNQIESSECSILIQNHLLPFLNNLPHIENEINVLSSLIQIPIFEINNQEVINHLLIFGIGALNCSIICGLVQIMLSSNTVHFLKPKDRQILENKTDSEIDGMISDIAEKGLQICNKIIDIYQRNVSFSTYSNLCTLEAFNLIKGISYIFVLLGVPNISGNLEEESMLRIISQKLQYGLVYTHINQIKSLLKQLSFIYNETQTESLTNIDQSIGSIENFSIFDNYLFKDRLGFITKNNFIHNMLSILAVISYKKACNARCKQSDDDPTCSESTTYFNDTYSCSDTESDESGSLLGILFKENAYESDEMTKNNILSMESKRKYSVKYSIKDESLDFINLSIEIYKFLQETTTMTLKYREITEVNSVQLCLFVHVLKEIDKESGNQRKTDIESIYVESKSIVSHTNKLSQIISEYVHNLLCNSILDENMQQKLLLNLNICPWKSESNWTLNISPRLLKILVQVLSLKPQQEKEAACLSVWHKMVESIINKLCNNQIEEEFDDINIEHAQILLYLFYSLNLMQKKSILLLTAGAVVRGASIGRENANDQQPIEWKILLLSRLLMFFEYMMKHLYTPPPQLLEQVEQILLHENFNKASLTNETKLESIALNNNEKSLLHKIPNYYTKNRKLYTLTKMESFDSDFKLDGLAWNFILCTPEKLKYQLLLDALVDIFGISDSCKEITDISILSVVQYTVSICLKLLIGLPPSIAHIEEIMQGPSSNIYLLLWTVRCSSPVQQTRYLVVNSLVKQGLYTQVAEAMWSKLTNQLCERTFHIDAFNNSLKTCIQKFDTGSITLLKLLIIDSTSVYFYINQNEATKSMIESSADLNQSGSNEVLSNLLNLFKGLKESSFKRSMADFEYDLPYHIVEMLVSILLPSDKINEVMNTFVKQLSEFVRQKESKIPKDEKHIKIAYESTFARDLSAECFIKSTLEFHLQSILASDNHQLCNSVQYTMKNILNMVNMYLTQTNIDKEQFKQLVISMLTDLRAEPLIPDLLNLSKILFEDYKTQSLENVMEKHILYQSYVIFKEICSEKFVLSSNVKTNLLTSILEFWCNLANEKSGKMLFFEIFLPLKENAEFVNILFSFMHTKMSHKIIIKILQLFVELMDYDNEGDNINELVFAAILKFLNTSTTVLKIWASHLMFGQNICYWDNIHEDQYESDNLIHSTSDANEFRKTLITIKKFFKLLISSKNFGKTNTCNIFSAFCQLGYYLMMPRKTVLPIFEYLDLLSVLNGEKQLVMKKMLLDKLMCWLQITAFTISDTVKNVVKLDDQFVENIYVLLNNTVLIMGSKSHSLNILSSSEDDIYATNNDYLEEVAYDEEESTIEESDDENLSTKMCTYLITQKDFMNQHWYYCYTCNMFDGIGVCTICAKVCHKNHDVCYAKYGNFFCDCGAKEDGTCIALTKKWNTNNSAYNGRSIDSIKRNRDVKKEENSDWKVNYVDRGAQSEIISDYVDLSRKQVMGLLVTFTYLLQELEPKLIDSCLTSSSLKCYFRAKACLKELHTLEKSYEFSESLVVSALGSQEGAFENVRMNYTGEQGTIIRQLISTNSVRRVGLCCLSIPFGTKQHLVVAQDKGKISILQLSTLLKQVDAGKQKLMITKLNSANVPCSIIISLSPNLICDDLLAICGIKECHVLQFSCIGSVKKHVVCSPHLEAGNYIKRSIWLPSSLSKLALITAETVQIYELSKDASKAEYCFLLPTGKIRDCTFAYQNDIYTMYVISSSGHIYVQTLCEESLAKNGNYYITQVLELKHPSLKDVNGQILGGGVSIYFSHALQMLFCSFVSGKNFSFSLENEFVVRNIFNIPTAMPSKMFSKNASQPLFNWTEVACHPGIIFAMFQNSNNIAVLVVTPKEFTLQELKIQNAKVKIMDFVAIRHNISGTEKTSLIVLCEDGSLKMYNANANKTSFWLSPEIKLRCIAWKSNRLKRNKSQKMSETISNTIPVDFFEHCNILTDVEYGGNDLLQLYSPNQIKHRLNTNGLYITSTKANGFSVTITNNDSSTITTGFRVLIGSQDPLKAPTFISVGNRTVSTNVSTYPRWVDFGLHRSEIITIQNENRLNIVFGNSQSPDNITMVDNIKIYGTTKENFGWPEETEEHANINLTTGYHSDLSPAITNSVSEYDQYHLYSNTLVLIAAKVLEIYAAFIQKNQSIETVGFKQDCLKFLSNVALIPVPSYIDQQIKKLMNLLIQDQDEYSLLKERLIVNNVFKQFSELSVTDDLNDVDPELFYLLVKSIHQITGQKPNDFAYVCKMYGYNIVHDFHSLISKLYKITPSTLNPFSLTQPGLLHVEFVFQVLVDTILCYSIDDSSLISQYEDILFEILTTYNAKIRNTVRQSLTNFFKTKNISFENDQGRKSNWTIYSHNQLKLQLINILCNMLSKTQEHSVKNECIVPLMQTLLSLLLTVKLQETNEKNVFINVLKKLLEVAEIDDSHLQGSLPIDKYDLTLLALKFLGLLMGKAKTSQLKFSDDADNKYDVADQTAKYLLETNLLQVSMNYLKSSFTTVFVNPKVDDNLLKSLNVNEMHYLQPFFNKCDLKSQNYQLFQPSVPQLSEGIIRLIYQITKIMGKTLFAHPWFKENGEELCNMLCDFMMDAEEQTIRRITRKTLLLICGSKDGYRNLKDQRCIQKYTKSVKSFAKSFSSQTSYSSTFDELVIITIDLKNCYDIAVVRPLNWCQSCNLDEEILQALFSCSCAHNEEVLHTIIIKLIYLAIQHGDLTAQSKMKNIGDETLSTSLESSCCKNLLSFLLPDLLQNFVTKFLQHNCSVSLKWQVHQVLHMLYVNADKERKSIMLNLFWDIFKNTSISGKLSPHFIDLLGYFTHTSKMDVTSFGICSNQVLQTIKNMIKTLIDHPSSHFYPYLHYILETDGFYFDREPCLECNNVEIQPSTLKLSAIKADARFSTCSMILKLIQGYCISKIFLRITDIKKSKMVRTINILYSNHNIQATVDLKSKVETWRKAKSIKLQPGQTDVRIDFSLPITACNLMIEYVDFYETIVGCSETLQCPRCSAVVSSNPGICGNCGENVFQCHKCRAINYDEKDPFLCNSCGFSKFAKFDYTLVGKPSFLIDAIENDEERNKMIQLLRNIMEKADRIYRQLQANKRIIELLLFRSSLTNEKLNSETFANLSTSVSTTGINKTIHIIAQKYCVESKTLYDDLCMLLYKIKAHRSSILQYDKKQNNSDLPKPTIAHQNCYRCILTCIVECLKLYRSLTLHKQYVKNGSNIYVINSLLSNFHRGTMSWQIEIANLIANIVKNDTVHTTKICKILKRRFISIISSCLPEYCIDVAIRGDLLLMEALASIYDLCWEIKFKTTFELLLLSSSHKHAPALLITQSCLRILLSFAAGNKSIEDSDACTTKKSIDFKDWSLETVCFDDWKANKSPQNKIFVQEKYFNIWKNGKKQYSQFYANWLIGLVFNSYSTDIRQMFCSILTHLSKYQEKRLWCIDMSTNLLHKIGENNNNAVEFINYFKLLILRTPWQQYLVLHDFLDKLINLISLEINKMLDEEKVGFFLSQSSGYALIQLVEILNVFWDNKNIREQNKRNLLKPVLEGYLNIRKMSLQRNLSIEYAQEKLLLILENITSGNEEDITHFMTVCIEILNCSPEDDIKTKVFAFERLCSLIHQDESDVGEFFLSLEKDPQQEDFLQGRMLGNPYSSAESGLGPLMKDIKNKICRDCELIALLEDDNGMELLVSNKIINLDLLVKDIYKNVWLVNGGDRDTMKIVYRMRGLLGDATEEFVETVEDNSDENIDYEKKHRMANVVVDCGGLEVMLNCLKCDSNLNANRLLLEVVLKLFSLCSKVKRCQEALCRPEMKAMEIFLRILDLCIQNESPAAPATNLIENLLEIMNTILTKAASDSLDLFLRLSLTFGGVEYVRSLLNYASSRPLRFNSSQMQIHLAKVLAGLVYGNDIKMAHLCEYFKCVLDFNEFEKKHDVQDEQKLELFCVMANSIEPNIVGNILKDYIMNLGIVDKSLNYILNAPTVKLTLFKADCPDLKKFISRPALKYVLRILTGLSIEHEPTQLAITAEAIPIIHMLEQVSSDEHVGTLAENLLETLCANVDIAKKVAEVRNLTKAEKKRLAMATREKQLNLLGMKANEKGQVTVNVNPLEEIEKLKEETGLFCFICREGYTYQPTKVLGIYTYSKRVVLEEFETKPRKQIGYSTVTHFNIIHVDCHISAIRLARGREEWESASLQNTNTKCNGILPLWGPEVPEISFATCVNRQQNYIRDATQCNDINFQSSVHDLKLLLQRFAYERSFHVDSGGGGPQSNLNFVPYLLFHAIYILLSSHSVSNEQKKLNDYIALQEKRLQIAASHAVEGPLYYLASSLSLQSILSWKKNRVEHLKRLIITAQVRHFYPSTEVDSLSPDQQVEEKYEIYKPYLMIWSLVELIYSYFDDIKQTKEEDWPVTVFNYIRYHDEQLLKTSEQILRDFSGDYIACTSFGEFCDVAGLFEEIEDPMTFISSVLSQ